jgi:hypothetical protein
MSNILESCSDLTELISSLLTSLDASRLKVENLSVNSDLQKKLKSRTLEYLQTCLADLLMFYEFLSEVRNCEGDYLVLSELLTQETE